MRERPLRIALDYRPALDPRPDGIGQSVRSFTLALAALQHPHDLVLFTDRPCTPPPGTRSLAGPTRVGAFSAVRWHLWCARAIERERIDVYVSLASLVVPVLRPERTLLFVHDLSPLDAGWLQSPKVRWLSRLLLGAGIRRARRVVVNSEFTRERRTARWGLPKQRIAVASLGLHAEFAREVDEATRSRVRAALQLPARFLLCVGTRGPRKNLPGMLRAWSILRTRRRDAPALVVVGKPGARQRGLLRALRRLDPTRQVRFLDFVSQADLPAVYALADMLVYPSFYEGFGLPLLEAMAMGVPIVTSGVSALPEVAGDAALYADPHSPEKIASRIAAILDDPALAQRLRAAGRARVTRFTWQSFAEQMRAVIEGLPE